MGYINREKTMTTRANEQQAALAATVVYGVIALFLLACASAGWYGAFQPEAAPALVLVAGIFTLLGCGAVFATLHCAALTRK